MPKPRHLLAFMLAAGLLTGCGLKGPLYLPEKKSDEREQAARQEPAEEGQEESPSAAAPALP